MAADAALLGLAIVLTLAAGLGLASYDSLARRRAWRLRAPSRPGAVALLIGFGVAVVVTGKLEGNLFLVPAAAVAALSGLDILRRNGRLVSFGILWASADLVVLALRAEIPAFGAAWADVAFTALLLACFCSLLREIDIVGSYGWVAALATAGATAVICYRLDRADDATLAVLVTGAVFAIIASAPFGGGMLGRVGARVLGLVIGSMAIRAAVGSPELMLGVAAIGVLCALGFVVALERPARGRVTLGLAVGAGVLAVAAIPASAALLDVYEPIRDTVRQSRDFVKATPKDGLDGASVRLRAIEAAFRTSERRLDSTSVDAGKFVPFLGVNLRAATSSTQVAGDLAASARRLVDEITVKSVAMKKGTVARADLDRLIAGLRAVRADVRRAQARIEAGGSLDLLVPELREGVEDLDRQVAAVDRRVSNTLDGAVTATRLLGYGRPQRYFVAVQNNAESRATGGYIANYGILVADQGHVTLPQFRRTVEFDAAKDRPRTLHAPKDYRRRYSRFDVEREWTNVNMSPDFPTVAGVMADQYKQYSGTSVDGVIAIDPVSLAKLLELTGPIRVAGWPVPITANNAVAILLHDEYVAFEGRLDDRVDFIGRVAKAVFDHLTDSGLSDLIKAGSVIHDVTTTRHVQVWARDDLAAKFLRRTRADGRVPDVRGDALMVTTQNAAGNKLDYYLRRSVTYDAKVRRADGRVFVDATLTLRLRNEAPATGQPRYIIGPFDGRFKAGQNRTYLTVYSPLEFGGATLDGQPLTLTGAPELGRVARSSFVDIPPGATRTIVVHLSGFVAGSKRYALDLLRQPLSANDEVNLNVEGAGRDGKFALIGLLKRDLVLDLPTKGS